MKYDTSMKLTEHYYIGISKNTNIHLIIYFKYDKTMIIILRVNSKVKATDQKAFYRNGPIQVGKFMRPVYYYLGWAYKTHL